MPTAILTFLGVLAAVLATLFTAWQGYLIRKQLRQADLVAAGQFYQSITKATSEMHRLFLDRPDLRPLFYEDKAATDDGQHQRALAMAGFIVDLAEGCIAAEPALPGLFGDWDDHIHFLYSHSPAIREFWRDFGHLYPDGVERALIGPSARPKVWPPHMKAPIQDGQQEVPSKGEQDGNPRQSEAVRDSP